MGATVKFELLCNGSLVGIYPSEDDAMQIAKTMGMLRADGTLDEGHALRVWKRG